MSTPPPRPDSDRPSDSDSPDAPVGAGQGEGEEGGNTDGRNTDGGDAGLGNAEVRNAAVGDAGGRDTGPDPGDGSAISVAPTLTLPRWALPVVVISVIGFGLAVYSLFPDAVGGPPLPVRVEIEQALIETVGGAGSVPAEVVSVTNQADFPIPHLVVVLNGHYRLDRQSPIAPGETLQLPQTIFTDKRSSRRFDPILQDVTKVVVNGQLPEGTRGVSVFRFDGQADH